MDRPSDLIRSTEARKLIGISHIKMSELLKKGVLRVYDNPLDAREKLVSKSEVLALKPRRVEAA